jgi:E3 ubiquitin-protein ligase RNF1/2
VYVVIVFIDRQSIFSVDLRTKRSRITSDNDSGAEDTTDSESRAENRIPELDLVFKPHPVEMGDESDWPKALKDNSVRYLKTTANATGI